MKYLVFSLTLLLIGCGSKSDVKTFELNKNDYQNIINKTATPDKPDLAQYKTITNADYPIEIAIFEDGKWYYDLPNLDTGFGTWKYTEGALKLFAQRALFDMHINVVGLDEGAEILGIDFSDRHGRRVIPVEKILPSK